MAKVLAMRLADGSGFQFMIGPLDADDAKKLHMLLSENDYEIAMKKEEIKRPNYNPTELDKFYGDY